MQFASAVWCAYVEFTERDRSSCAYACPCDEQEVSYIAITERCKANEIPERCIGVFA
jgi:hypothetical protein